MEPGYPPTASAPHSLSSRPSTSPERDGPRHALTCTEPDGDHGAQRAAGQQSGDHFAKPGANNRIWGRPGQARRHVPRRVLRLLRQRIVALASWAWLGPDYRLGFMPLETAADYPEHVHRLCPVTHPAGARSRTATCRWRPGQPCRASTGPGRSLPSTRPCWPQGIRRAEDRDRQCDSRFRRRIPVPDQPGPGPADRQPEPGNSGRARAACAGFPLGSRTSRCRGERRPIAAGARA